ncbi:nSTAND1 domain-containing NTPase [Streptosporangium soli]|nr:tetratricopeptide repeat protein [Streptosporangium sp. KLBMP 9127]
MGLRSFSADDRARFFGRTRESQEISTLWSGNLLTVLFGPSGVGKTSVLHAGVLPAIDPARYDVLPTGRVSHGSAFPTAALPEHNPYTFALLSSWSPAESPIQLSGLTIADFLRRRAMRLDRYGDPVPVLVAIDQFEEIFSDFRHRERYRHPFIRELADALQECPDVRLLVSVRQDYIAEVLPYEGLLGRGLRARFKLAMLSPAAGLEAVSGPLAGTGRSFAPGAASSLVRDLSTITVTSALGERSTISTDEVEPTQLQVICSTLWESLPAGVRVITREHIARHADVDHTLAAFCERALAEVSEAYGVPAARLWSWLRETFITEMGRRDTAYEGMSSTAGMPNPVVHALIDRHILKTEMRSGSRWCELQHDRLIQPILLGEADAPGARLAPHQADAHDYLRAASLALADGQLDLAEQRAQEALGICRDDELRLRAETQSFLGNIAHDRGEWERAEERYHAAADLYGALQDAPAVGRLLAAIARLLLRRGRAQAAVEQLRSAVQRVPNDLTVQTELAVSLLGSGHPQAAMAVLDGVLAAESMLEEALRLRGEIRADIGDPASALRDLDRLRRPPRPTTRAARALALANLGLTEAAAATLTEVLSAESLETHAPAHSAGPGGPHSDDATVLYYAARALALLGRAAAAAELARRAYAAADPALPPHQHAALARLLEDHPTG